MKVASIVELSGGGASAGTQFNNGLQMAIKEINADGGILGRKIEVSTNDTTTQPGVALALTKKAVDQDVFAIFGPVFSGSINVSMKESQKAEIPNFTGGEAANITTQGNPLHFPHQLHASNGHAKSGSLHQQASQNQKPRHHLCEQ